MPQDNNQTILSKRHDEDCLGCRLVSGFGVLGMGVYLFNTGQKQTTRFNRRAIILLSFGTCGIGIARLLALPPFQKQSKENTK